MKATSSSGSERLGCLGKCTSGLSLKQLDLITDHVQRTLEDSRGRAMFGNYLSQARKSTDLRCLELYAQCEAYIEKEQRYRLRTKEPSIEALEADVNLALSLAEDLDEVPEIDLGLLEKYTEALANRSGDSMIRVLEDTMFRLMNHLRQSHKGFRAYVMLPCPRS